MALEQGVAGIVLCPVHGTGAADLDLLLGPPGAGQTVLFSRGLEGVALPQFVNDDRRAGRIAAECLLSRRHERLMWLGGGQETSTARDRFRGFLDACSDAGCQPQVRHGPTSRRFGHEAATAALRGPDPPQGFVCFSDLIAFGVISACHACGMTPGRDVSVIGCDDMEEAAFTIPRLTTVQVDKQGIGIAAARAALQPGETAERRLFAPELILRDSVALAGPAG
jgi:LacI family transcriptional regulator